MLDLIINYKIISLFMFLMFLLGMVHTANSQPPTPQPRLCLRPEDGVLFYEDAMRQLDPLPPAQPRV